MTIPTTSKRDKVLSEFGIFQLGIHNFHMQRRRRYKFFQKALIDARQAQGLTQTEVAQRLGKPQSYVSKYESGERRLDVVEFLEICAAVNIEPQIILQEIEKVDGND